MDRLLRCLPGLALAVLLSTAPGSLRAVDPGVGDEAAVEAGRVALRSGGFPWYDQQHDALRRVRVVPPKDLTGNRGSTWESRPRQKRASNGANFTLLGKAFWSVMQALFWLILAVLLLGLVGLLVWAFLRRDGEAARSSGLADDSTSVSDAERIENLPFDVKRPQGDLLGEARRLYAEGRFAEAIVYLFSYQLVCLDRHQLIRLTKGKTNRQYLRELSVRPALRRLLEQTMLVFEDVFFGHYPLAKERFDLCWNQLDEFHHGVEQSP